MNNRTIIRLLDDDIDLSLLAERRRITSGQLRFSTALNFTCIPVGLSHYTNQAYADKLRAMSPHMNGSIIDGIDDCISNAVWDALYARFIGGFQSRFWAVLDDGDDTEFEVDMDFANRTPIRMEAVNWSIDK